MCIQVIERAGWLVSNEAEGGVNPSAGYTEALIDRQAAGRVRAKYKECNQ